jgi:hypothetical protein
MIAYCYASGLIEFGNKLPNGALPIAKGPAKKLLDFIEPVARHGYSTREVDGRPTKIPGSDCLLVPGVPEAPDQFTALNALQTFQSWIRHQAPEGVTVGAD